MFQGESQNKVDGSGRVSIPAKFRRVLQLFDKHMEPGGTPRLYVAYGDSRTNFLECLSGDAFDEIKAVIQAEPLGSPAREVLEHLYFTKCELVPIDDAGRLKLPAKARAKIDLEDEATFVGRGDKFHILKPQDEAAADGRIDKLITALGQDNEFFNPLSLAGRGRPTEA
ncbi:MAG: cell division/cell wall cluster transcriptional repressor MraZ [Pseudomonadota bacterium]